MNGASPARERRNAIAAQRLAAAPAPVVIRTRRSLLERLGAAVEAPFVALAAWWAAGKARSELAGLDADISELHDAISFDEAHVFRLRQRYASSPVLQERLARNRAELRGLCAKRKELAERIGPQLYPF
jgi:hypothetical protein